MDKIRIVYVSSNPFKGEENRIFCERCRLRDGRTVGDVFSFDIKALSIKERLEVDLAVMVREEVSLAYKQLRIPCIVEHAGLIFEEYLKESYPGGLTKPMWDTLGENFLRETKSGGRRAVARAVVAYCDGMSVQTFVGETNGTLSDSPRGKRDFYWDTVFIPDDATGTVGSRTYAEVVEDPKLGLDYKVKVLSQSSRAMLNFLEFRLRAGESPLWR